MYDTESASPLTQAVLADTSGHMAELERWSPRIAARIAEAEGIALEEDHWVVIFCLRERYRSDGQAQNARNLIREAEQEFADLGGRRYLYELFPHGPVAQACRIAGIPMPPGTLDLSFGSVH